MKVAVPKGKYVLAVSGGVDSMALLDMLAKMAGIRLVAAHFNHGIRPEAGLDEALVRDAAKRYSLEFEAGRANLGSGVSEETARQARYKFLEGIVRKHKAIKIITAHHQDDWIETALINTLRGSGRQGISAMLNNPNVLRPLIRMPKAEVVKYAVRKSLDWNEDSSNHNQNYLRNYLRYSIIPKLNASQRLLLLNNLEKIAIINIKLDSKLATLSQSQYKTIDRQDFSNLPTEVGQEMVVYLLRQLGVTDYDKRTIERLSLALKTAKPNSVHPIKANAYLDVKRDYAAFVTP